MPDARSSAGALGVMQLMPATARSTAKKEGLSRPSRHDLSNPHTNIRIGSAYLGEMFRKFDQNRILASAAYNAGPSAGKPFAQWFDEWYDDLARAGMTTVFTAGAQRFCDRDTVTLGPLWREHLPAHYEMVDVERLGFRGVMLTPR